MEIKGYDRVYATVDLDRIRENLNSMRRVMHPDAKICAVIKTDGYGHGAVPIAREIGDMVWGFAVATPDEALNLRHHQITQPILVLGYVNPNRYEEMIENEIRLPLFEYNKVELFHQAAEKLGKKGYVHVKVDTGMSRLGLFPDAAGVETIVQMAQLPGVEIEGLFTHMATADMKENQPALQQIEVFRHFVEELLAAGVEIPICHCDNSAGTMTLPQGNFQMCRVGISMYGLYPSDELDWSKTPISPALSLYSQVIYVKKLPEGTAIGYGGTYKTTGEQIIATVSIGYGDGYPRSLSNVGQVLIRGQRANIVGRICMDQMMVDVTHIPQVLEGDLVTLIGRDGTQQISMEESAQLAHRFNYEFACDLGKRIPRVFLKNGKIIGKKDYFIDQYE